MSTQNRHLARHGFTLMELLMSIAVIFALMGLIIAGVHFTQRFTRTTADTATVSSLKQAVAQFEQEHGFLPPLVKDYGNPAGSLSGDPTITSGGENRVVVFTAVDANDLQFLRTSPPASQPDMRFSIYTIPYYILGVCEVPRQPSDPAKGPIDGVGGPGLHKAKRDGTFERSGKSFDPFFDLSRNTRSLVTVNAAEGRIELRDRNDVPIRFYRWEHGKPTANANGSNGPVGAVVTAEDLNVPRILGSPDANPELKSAKYAILGAGPNGLFGNEHQLDTNHPLYMSIEDMAIKLGMSTPATQAEIDRVMLRALEDNVVGVGR